MSTVSSDAATRREAARDRTSGEFGHQDRTAPVDLDAPFDPAEPFDPFVVGTDPDVLADFDWDEALSQLGETVEADTSDEREKPNAIRDTLYSDIDKDARLDAMKADLQAAVKDIVDSGRLKDWLDQMRDNGLGRWSFQNQILATFQGMRARETAEPEALEGIPDQLMVMSANDWKSKYGRVPRKGSKAIWVLAPATRTITDEDPLTGEERKRTLVYGFRAQPKFDACQTTGNAIPDTEIIKLHDGAVDPVAVPQLSKAIEGSGYRLSQDELSFGDVSASGRLGYTDPKTMRVVVDSRLPDSVKVSVLAHELAHIKHDHVADIDEYRRHRGRMETEAEATAYLIARHYGVDQDGADSFSPGYIAGWSKGDPEVLNKALSKATRVFQEVVGLR